MTRIKRLTLLGMREGARAAKEGLSRDPAYRRAAEGARRAHLSDPVEITRYLTGYQRGFRDFQS